MQAIFGWTYEPLLVTEKCLFCVWYKVIVQSQPYICCQKKRDDSIKKSTKLLQLQSHMTYKTVWRHCSKSNSLGLLYILGTHCGQCVGERAGVSTDERAVWYLCEFYIPAVLTVNKGLVDGSISRAGSGLDGGRRDCYPREKLQGMIKVVNICRCRGPAVVQN